MRVFASSCGTLFSSNLSLISLLPHFEAHIFFSKARKPLSKTLNAFLSPSKNPSFCHSLALRLTSLSRVLHVPFSSPRNGKEAEVELLGKPSPVSIPDEEEASASSKSVHLDDALAPFLKFFKARDLDEKDLFGQKVLGGEISKEEKEKVDERKRIGVEYYDPKPGGLVVL